MRLALALLSLCVALTAGAQEKTAKKKAGGYPPTIEGTKSETYRKVGDTELKVWIFEPATKATKPLPAIVFFFGGGWVGGSPTQFEPQSRHLAARGMIAIVADYRVKTRQDAKPADCVADAKACVRWVRANAARLGIDPERIAVGGGSAGGHLAASVATLPGLDDAKDDKSVSCIPDALVLFNPGTVMDRDRLIAAITHRQDGTNTRTIDVLIQRLRAKLGDDPKAPRIFTTSHGEGYVFTALLD